MAPVTPRPPLELYPAIDLKAGRCVRLLHGEMAAATVYNDDPAAQADLFAAAGYDRLHIVDLDGAFSGRTENRDAVAAILKVHRGWRQLGGGIRSLAAVEHWLGLGIDRVVLGTAAVRDPEFVRAAARTHPGRIAVGIDARDGLVRTDGWAGKTGHTVSEIAKRFEDQGVSALIFTDIGRDGALAGVNVEATAALSRTVAIPVIASGGVADASDIARLAGRPEPIGGVIIGRALYDGRITPSAAHAAARRAGA